LLVATVASAHQGPGRVQLSLMGEPDSDTDPKIGPTVGTMEMWNTGKRLDSDGNDVGSKLLFQVSMLEDQPWLIYEAKVYAGRDPVPLNKKGAPEYEEFTYHIDYNPPTRRHTIFLDLTDDLAFTWGERPRVINVAVKFELRQVDQFGEITAKEEAWAYAGEEAVYFEGGKDWGFYFTYELAHPKSGQFIDAPVKGLGYFTPTHSGITGEPGPFQYFPGESVDFYIDSFYLGTAYAVPKVSPLDLYLGGDLEHPEVIGVARTLQTLDSYANPGGGSITIFPEVAACFADTAEALAFDNTMFGDEALVTTLLTQTITNCQGLGGAVLVEAAVTAPEAQGNLEAGLNASGIFRKNISKTEDLGEDKQKLDVVQVYLPGRRSNGDPSMCVDANSDGIYDESTDQLGVPYEEWRLGGDPAGEECDPRVDGETCVVTLIECRELAKPLVVVYNEGVDIYDDQITTEFWPHRFSNDTYAAVSRDDGTTWKRMNVSRMADLSSFDLETGEPFPGHTHSANMKVNDNHILVVWNSTFCKSGNPRYAINTCDDPLTDEIEADDPATVESECAIYCRGNAEQGTEVCEPDYPYDDAYAVTDIWGVRGQQQSVDYDEVDDVAELGIGEIPYSCLWAARGVIVTQSELDEGTFNSLLVADDPETPDVDETKTVELGDIIWYKPERLTSGRRDAYIPMVGAARGAGFAIAWQEDPDGLRPGKGKGPGQGWSGAISNHKSDIWYTFLHYDDFAKVDENFVPGGPPDDGGPDERPGVGRPKYEVPFALPVRISDNDMVNTDTLKVQLSSQCVTPPGGTDPVCFPEVDGTTGTFVPLDPEEIANQFCDGPDPIAECCDHDNHETDPNCEGLEGLHGNLTGTKRYAYLAKTLDDDGDGVLDYQYYLNRGGTLDLCDTTAANSYMDAMPGTSARERWFGFANVEGSSKLVCVTSDGRLLDGDVSASRPNIQMQGYTKPDGTKSAWVLLAYEESKGLGHSLAASEHDDALDDLVGEQTDDSGQDKPIKQDLGKNVIYHTFDFTQPDLVDPGHILNLPALCGGLYPNYCDDPKTPDVIETDEDNPTCTCEPGDLIPLYFDYQTCTDPNDPATCEWLPDVNNFLQYRTEIARRVRFIVQPLSRVKTGVTNTLGAIIFKQGQEGQGRPADVFIRRMVKSGTGNPYKFENIVCDSYLDESEVALTLAACPNGAGDKPSAVGYNCNVWGEASGDRLCGGIFTDPNGGYLRRDHVNLTSAEIDLALDAGPDDGTPDDPTDDVYGTNKVLLWTQTAKNLGDESFGNIDGSTCDHLAGDVCPGMYSNARSHRGFMRGDFLVAAYAGSPNWAAARNGRDRYNFYIRKSFDGGQTWTTNPEGTGINYCREFRTDPETKEPPVFDGFDAECVNWCAPEDTECTVTGVSVGAGEFEQAIKVSDFDNNKETSSDPRVGATPPTYPLDGTITTGCTTDADGNPSCPLYVIPPAERNPEDEYVDNIFFVAWGAGDNLKSIGGTTVTPEAPPTDTFYTRSTDYGDHYLKIPWVIGGENSNLGVGETVYRYDFLAKGDEEEQGECQLRATSDGSKMYSIYHELIPVEEDPDAEITRWYPWEPEPTLFQDLFFRRVIFWPDEMEVLP
jgi:hypothetical protein